MSERALAEGFNSFWHEVMPMLTPSFMSLFNERYVYSILEGVDSEEGGIPLNPNVTDYGIVAEMAFHVARIAHDRRVPIDVVLKDASVRVEIDREIAIFLARENVRSRRSDFSSSEDDWNEVGKLTKMYSIFLARYRSEEIQFSPLLPGHGFLRNCTADLSVGATLYEIKTVTRNFSAHDLRQLFVYLALQAATGSHRWSRGGLFNPRRGRAAEFSVEYLLYKVSGGVSAREVFDQILSFLGSRSVVVDSTF